MTHYFSQNFEVPEDVRRMTFTFQGETFAFDAASGVFSKNKVDRGTEILLEAVVSRGSPGRLLDLCCGYGVVGIVLARCLPGSSVVLSDLTFLAVRLASVNLKLNRQKGASLCADGTSAFRDATFDLVAVNPPMRMGKHKVLHLLDQGIRALRPEGRLFFVGKTKQGACSIASELRTRGWKVEEVERESGYRVFGCHGDSRSDETTV